MLVSARLVGGIVYAERKMNEIGPYQIVVSVSKMSAILGKMTSGEMQEICWSRSFRGNVYIFLFLSLFSFLQEVSFNC